MSGRDRYRILSDIAALAFLLIMVSASLFTLIETDTWWVRYLDFPRLQLAITTAFVLLLWLGLRKRRRRWVDWVVLAAALAGLLYHAYKLHPYSGLAAPAAVMRDECLEGQSLRVMVANVKRKNESADQFLTQVEAYDPDLLLIMETDAWWDKQLAPLNNQLPYEIQSIPESDAYFGMHLFSKLPLLSPEFHFFFGADTPTATTRLQLPEGQEIGFIGLHPKPPLAWAQPTTMRDAHLLQASLMVKDWNIPTVIAGDFNAVPWERVTRRAMRIGGLLDPRVGRGLYPTYDVNSWLMSWPLDQILFQPQFALMAFGTLPDFGSDHRAVTATLCYDPAAALKLPEVSQDDLAEAQRSLRAAREVR